MLKIREKISHRFFVAILLIVVIPIAIMGYECAVLARKSLTGFAFLHMATIAENRASFLESWLEERLDDVGVLADLPSIRDACEQSGRDAAAGGPGAAGELLEDTLVIVAQRSSSYENLYILLPDGKILATTRPEVAGLDRSGGADAILRLTEGDKPVLGPLYQPPGKEAWHVQLASKIQGRGGETVAFIIAVLDLSKTVDPIMVERFGLGETGETYLVSKDGKIISESRFLERAEIQGRSFDTVGIRAALEEKRGTSIYENYMGREVLGSYVWLPRYDWGILAEMETDEIMWPLVWIKTIGILSTALVGAICLLMAYVVSRRVSGPIVQVADAAENMAEGNLEQRIPFSSRDEVGRLAASFNAMAERLSHSVASLQQKEESLQKAYNELITAQEQLLQSERMAAVGELVASVAHELRSPLSSIKLNLQIIGRSLGRETVLYEHHEIALDQVAQMERMFSDLLDYSKPFHIQKKDIPVEDLVNRCLQELEGEIAARGIRVERRIEPDLPPLIADPDKIEQVLVNVLRNALEASRAGGRIEISAVGGEEDSTGHVIVRVTDYGSGISPRNLKSIFQPFFTTKKKGTGLGLAIVKKIVDAHRGEIVVTSEEGKGTTVRVTLPGVRGAI